MKPEKKKILFRVDAASYLGLGHLYQSLALAEEFMLKDIAVSFAMKEFESGILSWVSSMGIEVLPLNKDAGENEESETLLAFLKNNSFSCVIIDHHTLSYEYSAKIKEAGIKIAQIDDEGIREFCCDLLINYNIYAHSLNYNLAADTRCLFGPQFAILRSQFRGQPKKREPGRRLLVSLGGGYARGEVIKVLKAIELMDNSQLEKTRPMIILGPGYPSPEKVIKEYSRLPVNFYRNLENIREVMEEADFAVSAGGGTLYELCRMGVPSIIITLDDNQKLNSSFFDRSGISRNLGWYEDITPETISAAIEEWTGSPQEIIDRRKKALALVDGLGNKRVAENIIDLLPG